MLSVWKARKKSGVKNKWDTRNLEEKKNTNKKSFVSLFFTNHICHSFGLTFCLYFLTMDFGANDWPTFMGWTKWQLGNKFDTNLWHVSTSGNCRNSCYTRYLALQLLLSNIQGHRIQIWFARNRKTNRVVSLFCWFFARTSFLYLF